MIEMESVGRERMSFVLFNFTLIHSEIILPINSGWLYVSSTLVGFIFIIFMVSGSRLLTFG